MYMVHGAPFLVHSVLKDVQIRYVRGHPGGFAEGALNFTTTQGGPQKHGKVVFIGHTGSP